MISNFNIAYITILTLNEYRYLKKFVYKHMNYVAERRNVSTIFTIIYTKANDDNILFIVIHGTILYSYISEFCCRPESSLV